MKIYVAAGFKTIKTRILVAFLIALSGMVAIRSQGQTSNVEPPHSPFGYIDLGDSIEFVFGQQQKIVVSGQEIVIANRIKEITQVNLAGDFNGWNPNAPNYKMQKVGTTLFKIKVSKKAMGKKGDLHQFKFVLNHQYWVEPPAEVTNKFTGADGNTNLTLRL